MPVCTYCGEFRTVGVNMTPTQARRRANDKRPGGGRRCEFCFGGGHRCCVYCVPSKRHRIAKIYCRDYANPWIRSCLEDATPLPDVLITMSVGFLCTELDEYFLKF
jgi:hypothetical protein